METEMKVRLAAFFVVIVCVLGGLLVLHSNVVTYNSDTNMMTSVILIGFAVMAHAFCYGLMRVIFWGTEFRGY